MSSAGCYSGCLFKIMSRLFTLWVVLSMTEVRPSSGYYTLRKKPGIVDKLVVHFLQTFLVKK